MDISFKQLTEADLPTFTEWLNRPHVAEHWDGSPSLEEVREEYFPQVPDPSAAVPYFAYLDDKPVGYVQSYVACGSGGGWWPDEQDPGVRGIDLFLADATSLSQGLGTRIVSAFVELLFQDPEVTKIQIDPAPDNARAIHCYEKAGFRRAGVVGTPDGPALLMILERP